MVQGYVISTKIDDMNVAVIHHYISRSYWASNIPLTTMEKAIKNSLCFGVFTEANEQVAFARMVTDCATFAYLADVFVLDSHRGLGLSKWLMKTILAHPELQGIRRMALATSDAHGLYQQFGFKALASPESFMELHNADVYRSVDVP
ncbi:MAG: GNAT family N-acetyltransferase [Colwellia sp.]|nr:GNAT family N-acetyltransferase [Colwellia sp.]